MNSPVDVHADFALAFTDGATLVDADGETLVVHRTDLGNLPLRSGALGVGDAVVGGVWPLRAPSGDLPAGEHPVDLSLVRSANGDIDVAAARIRFAAAPVVRWELAEFGAAVDSGVCAFIDGDTEGWSAGEDTVAAMRGVSYLHRRDSDGRWVCAFASGIGDCLYDGWWGLDAGGRAVAYVLDFDLLVTFTVEDVELPWPLPRGRIDDPVLRAHGITASVGWLRRNRLRLGRGDTWAYARWRMPDGRFVRPSTTYGTGAVIHLKSRPPGATLVLRVVIGRRPMALADREHETRHV